jgi:8-oxo-dGTP pyrophosphatase MutT (NUDIX family)
MKKDFTATCYIINNKKVLLIKHKKLKKWLPPGGHIDPNETPPDAARREALEETGLIVEIIPQENLHISEYNARTIERPYLCLLEEIPAYGSTPAHQHIDFIYLARPIGGKESLSEHELDDMKWFTEKEVLAMDSEEIFKETQQTITHILAKYET